MKKLTIVLLLLLVAAVPACAKFASKGYVPAAEGLRYSGFAVSAASNSAKITLINENGTGMLFSAAVAFKKGREEVASIYIKDVAIPAGGKAELEELTVTGDARSAKKAETLNWTIYTFEPQK
jgi:hypothetical protein